jgi:hypothetical protein
MPADDMNTSSKKTRRASASVVADIEHNTHPSASHSGGRIHANHRDHAKFP